MKVILSRKGFDLEYGGYPSPILPDKRMISLPIPSNTTRKSDLLRYSDLSLNLGKYKTYYDLMKELFPKGIWHPKKNKDGIKLPKRREPLTSDTVCHVDPDLYRSVLKRKEGWRPLFGQIDKAQRHLEKQKVGIGDIFLFFGSFRETRFDGGEIMYDKDATKKHVIFGYLQVEKIIKRKEDLLDWMKYHPHNEKTRWEGNRHNTIYVARDSVSWDNKIPGAGVFDYRKSLVLTKDGLSMSCWNLPDLFRNIKISYNPNPWNADHFKSTGRGQEFVIQENEKVEDWAKSLIEASASMPSGGNV